MKKFIIHCTTNWCGMDNDYAVVANDESELDEIADQLSSDNFNDYNLWNEIAEEKGYDVDEMSESDWDELYETEDEYNYRGWTIEEIDESNLDSLEEWSLLELVNSSDNNETNQDN